MITAMTTALIILAIIALAAVTISTLRDLHDDGYGRRQPPPSHYPDQFQPGVRLGTR